MEEAFKIKLKEDRNSVNLNSVYFSKQKYDEVITKILEAKSKTKNKSPSEHKLLKKYDVLETDGVRRLVVPTNKFESNIIYYVHDDELFDILTNTHLSLDHGGRDRMMKELKKSYKNITYKDIMIFLNLCRPCNKKCKREKKDEKSTPNKLNSKCEINILDYRSHPDGDYKFVLIYQELVTKFCFLKPLKSNDSEEVAQDLIDIFTLIGPPAVLQSDDEDFVKSLIDTVTNMWKELQIAYVKSEDFSESLEQEIDNMIGNWMRDSKTSRWSEGLRFVQLKKNTTFHPVVKKSPYDALFRRPLNFGLTLKTGDENDSLQENTSGQPEVIWKTEPLDDEYEEEYDKYDETDEFIKEEIMDTDQSEQENYFLF